MGETTISPISTTTPAMGTPVANRMAFAANDPYDPYAQYGTLSQAPADEFVKQEPQEESHAVRNGAIIAGGLGAINVGHSLYTSGGFTKLAEKGLVASETKLGAVISKIGVFPKLVNEATKDAASLTKTKLGAIIVGSIALAAAVGAGAGAIYEHFTTKEA